VNFDKIRNAKLPKFPKDLDDDEIEKSYVTLEKEFKKFKKASETFLGEVATLKERIGSLQAAIGKPIKNRSKDPKKAKAAETYLGEIGSFKNNF